MLGQLILQTVSTISLQENTSILTKHIGIISLLLQLEIHPTHITTV